MLSRNVNKESSFEGLVLIEILIVMSGKGLMSNQYVSNGRNQNQPALPQIGFTSPTQGVSHLPLDV